MNKKELQNKINNLKSEIFNLEHEYSSSVECVRLFKLFKEAETNYKKAVHDYKISIQPVVDKKYDELNELVETSKRMSEEKKYKPSQKIAEWFKKYTQGIDFGKIEVFWADENEEYVIIKNYGGMSWSGLGSQSYYPTNYWVSKISDSNNYENKFFEFEGRMNKAKMAEFIENINKLKTNSYE